MSFLMIKLERLKNQTVVLVLTLFLFIHELACLAGFFVLPFIRYPEKARNIWLIVWFYVAIVFALDMIYGIYKQCHEKEKEIQKYQQDKVYYWALNIGILFFVCIAFLFVFLVRNQYLILTWSQIASGVLIGITIFMLVMVMLLLYKGKYKSMFRDLAVVWGLLVCLCLLVMGVLLASDEKYKTASQVLILVGAIPLCIWGIKTFCKMFLSNKNIAKDEDTFAFAIFISLCIAVVFGVMVYYLIADNDLRDIMGNMLAAALGGFITLVGVAWTIKDGNEKRQADFKRVEEERKEEERKKNIPYIRMDYVKELPELVVNAAITQGLNWENPEERTKLVKNSFFQIMIQDFQIKNISNANIIMNGVIAFGKFYAFSRTEIVEPGVRCLVKTTNNYAISAAQPEQSIFVVISDTLGNRYKTECHLAMRTDSNLIRMTTNIDGEEYTGYDYPCVVTSLDLPTLVNEGDLV